MPDWPRELPCLRLVIGTLVCTRDIPVNRYGLLFIISLAATLLMVGVVRDNEELNSHIASNTALARVGLPDDIGSAVVMLLAQEAGWKTVSALRPLAGSLSRIRTH